MTHPVQPRWQEIYERLAVDSNDATALRALQKHVERWARAVFSVRGRYVIEDAVAETCAAVVVGIADARGAETFAGFAYGHFLNVRRRLLREQTWRQRLQELRDLDIPSEAPEESPDAELEALLRRALATLPERERKAVTLRYFQEQSAAHIAAELGVTNGNARRIVFNGLRRLRTHMREVHDRGWRERVIA